MQHAVVNLSGYMSSNGLTSAQVLAVGDVDGDHYVTNGDMQALLNLLIGGGGSLESNVAGSSQNTAAANSLPVTPTSQTEPVTSELDSSIAASADHTAADSTAPPLADSSATSNDSNQPKQADLTSLVINSGFHDGWGIAATQHVFVVSSESQTSKPFTGGSADFVAPLDDGYDWASSYAELVRHHTRRDLMEDGLSLDALDAIFQSGDLKNSFSGAGKIG